MPVTKRAAMLQNLQTKKATPGNFSLFDLKNAYFGGNLSGNDGVRAWLQGQNTTPGIQSLNDLWRDYFISKSITNRVSLNDMAIEYFATATLP